MQMGGGYLAGVRHVHDTKDRTNVIASYIEIIVRYPVTFRLAVVTNSTRAIKRAVNAGT